MDTEIGLMSRSKDGGEVGGLLSHDGEGRKLSKVLVYHTKKYRVSSKRGGRESRSAPHDFTA